MSERQRETEFYKRLISLENTELSRNLQERMHKVECDGECLRRTAFLMIMLTLLGLAGLGYTTLLLPPGLETLMTVLFKFFGAVALGSLLCLVGVVGYWLSNRSLLNELHEECRRHLMEQIEQGAHLAPTADSDTFASQSTPQSGTASLSVVDPDLASRVIHLPQHVPQAG